jgi:hypothetical protein
MIIDDAMGSETHGTSIRNGYKLIYDALCREYGKQNLAHGSTYKEQLFDFIHVATFDNVIDATELSMKYIDRVVRKWDHYAGVERKINADEAIEEINERFKAAGVGYQYESGEFIKIDSTYTHSEIVKPTLSLLRSKTFQGANEEYLKAHEHYRHGRNKEAVTECLKAFESTMKIICKEKRWSYKETDTSKTLIQICFDKVLIPSYLQTQFSSLRSLLESGVPTVRNRVGGHGQGQSKIDVDDHLVRYALNLTGSNIIFLVEQSGIK